MPETKDEVTIPDDVETIKDLRHHIRKVLDVPDFRFCSCGHGPTSALKKTAVLKDAQYIIDLEDNHSEENISKDDAQQRSQGSYHSRL